MTQLGTAHLESEPVERPVPGVRPGRVRPVRLGWVMLAVLAVFAVCGLLLRVWMLGNVPINSDEATAGLIGHEILHGHFFAHYWGQSYGGVEPYFLALSFLVAGQSALMLNGTPVLLALITSVVVWRIGLHLFRRPAAAIAAVLSWIWSESSLWNSTRETGFHQAYALLGTVILLEAVRIVTGARKTSGGRVSDWVILGGTIGLGLWASPEIIYFAVPATLVALSSLRHGGLWGALLRLVASGAAFVVGAAPTIWDTVHGNRPSVPPAPVSYASRLGTFFSHALPMILGLRIEGAGEWEMGTRWGEIAYVLLLVVVVAAAVVLVVANFNALVLVLTLALYPFLYAAFPSTWFWNDGRYGIGLTPVLALVVIGALWEVVRPNAAAWVSGALLVAGLASTLVAFNASFGAISNPHLLWTWTSNPNSATTALAARLEKMGVTDIYTGYWVANNVTYMSDGRIIAVSVPPARNPPEADAVGTKATVAWVFVPPNSTGPASVQLGSAVALDPGTTTEPQLTAWLHQHSIPYRRSSTGVFDIIVPARNVSPEELAG